MGRIEARVVTEGWEIGPGGVTIVERQAGDRVDLEVRIPKSNWRGWNANRSIRVELRVPAGVVADVRTGDGAINADSLSGRIRLHTGDGRIEATGVEGDFEAHTGDGDIRVRGRFEGLRISTGDGIVEAEVVAGSKMTAPWDVRTGDGSITLRLANGFAADLDAQTGDGDLTLDLPVEMAGKLRDSAAHGKLNGGGPVLAVRSGDGSIRIGRL